MLSSVFACDVNVDICVCLAWRVYHCVFSERVSLRGMNTNDSVCLSCVPVCDVTVGASVWLRVWRAWRGGWRPALVECVSGYEANALWQRTLPVHLLKWMILMCAFARLQVTLMGRGGGARQPADRRSTRGHWAPSRMLLRAMRYEGKYYC